MQGYGYSQYQAHSPHHQRSGELPKLYYKSLDHGTNGGGFNGPACMNSSSTWTRPECRPSTRPDAATGGLRLRAHQHPDKYYALSSKAYRYNWGGSQSRSVGLRSYVSPHGQTFA
ncbi:hypothetical protein PR002_g16285 [Phytophthora rubi]|nr:hypothetical protein PR002_g16285 [Phytophthora rubi]